jgi:FAD:protein FMN transferase
MACRFEILLHPDGVSASGEAAFQALDKISFLEQIFSVYLPTSELSLLNAKAHTGWVQVSWSTIELLRLGQSLWQETGGAFDMTAAKLSKAWGFHQRQGRMPSELEINEALSSIGSQFIELHEIQPEVRFLRPIELNPGGIGKGYAIDCAAESLKQVDVTSFALHGGRSSVLCAGGQSSATASDGWKIAVRHPERSEMILGTLILFDQALGTSGPANQFFYFQGKRYGHIIDPRTGWPATGMLSVTVLHPSAGCADALATGLFVMGLEAAIGYCERHPEVSMLAILPGKRSGECEVIACNMREGQWQPAY